ncbi:MULTISPECIES: DUF2892 domain-containing protein [unclassified Polaromonas]|uniref:YgaP family membrane protein n=1 Tax=unclassified Polaromonas TaxID=2638319 RepID=UPI000F080E17|nr:MULTISPECIES: DUF2892 domain-containing protein [unclassified Polaromonas]AYQ28926.1 DUF2892 domain-containing protein [Polaromonas sp. SP1]QGJ19957.1 DUF2892 domain-containing protein [Polaromonas sp. Pch-P]
MKKNVGAADRALRVVVGLVILSLYFSVEPAYRWWTLLGLVPLVTGAVGWCPAYTLLGIKTCEPGTH